MSKAVSYDQHIRRIVMGSALLSLLIVIAYGIYLQAQMLDSHARSEARKTSKMAFEALYSAMSKGWTQEEITPIIQRLNAVDPVLKIDIFRTSVVSAQYGLRRDTRAPDGPLLEAMGGEELLMVEGPAKMRFLYPVVLKRECLSCHSNAKAGQVAGVIDIHLPFSVLSFSFERIFNVLLLVFVVMLCGVFVFLYFYLRRHLVDPLKKLIEKIREIIASEDLTRSLHLKSSVKEVKDIEEGFNHLTASLHQSQERLKALTLIDHLTGLYNRRRFEEAALLEISRADRYENPFSIVMVDLDNFKPVNDTYGHRAGDDVLRGIGQLLKNHIRESDLAARLGGDEFVLLLPHTDHDGALRVVAKLSALLKQTHFGDADRPIHVTASFGVASFPDHGDNLGGLMEYADRQMYRQKR
ncbi:MAG: GGDEF domain-containing protein [Campylobacterales bacterium]